jgi:hypothetical protein
LSLEPRANQIFPAGAEEPEFRSLPSSESDHPNTTAPSGRFCPRRFPAPRIGMRHIANTHGHGGGYHRWIKSSGRFPAWALRRKDRTFRGPPPRAKRQMLRGGGENSRKSCETERRGRTRERQNYFVLANKHSRRLLASLNGLAWRARPSSAARILRNAQLLRLLSQRSVD